MGGCIGVQGRLQGPPLMPRGDLPGPSMLHQIRHKKRPLLPPLSLSSPASIQFHELSRVICFIRAFLGIFFSR